MKTFFPCCFCSSNLSRTWVFERAPEPSDIFWENMNVHICSKIFKIFFSIIATFIIMMICFGFISWIKSFKNQYDDDFKNEKKEKEDMSLYETGVAKMMSFAASGAVVIINELLLFVMRKLSRAEKQSTLTDLNVSISLKLTFARFLNSSLVLLFVNDEP